MAMRKYMYVNITRRLVRYAVLRHFGINIMRSDHVRFNADCQCHKVTYDMQYDRYITDPFWNPHPPPPSLPQLYRMFLFLVRDLVLQYRPNKSYPS